MRKFNCTTVCEALAMTLLGAGIAAAGETAQVDTSNWACEYCVTEQGYSSEVELGAGWVSDGDYKFGEYNGLEDDGLFLIGNLTGRYRDGKAGYLDLNIRDLGLDTRELGVEGGRQGSYSVYLNYDGIRHNITDTAQTPYLGTGSDNLQLPGGWVTAGSTAGMTQLNGSLQDMALETLRKRFGVGASFIPASRWKTAVDVRHEERDGQKLTSGAFFFNTAQLVEPVDYVTDEVEVAATYTNARWQSRLAYYGSFFNNHDNSLTWDNAYNPLTPGADTGQRALPPDNRFHQLLFSSGYQLSDRTQFSGDIALGRMEQDDALLATTINSTLAASVPALPRQSADARVNTITANLKATSALTDKLRINAAYRYNDRDNKTPVALFSQVSSDTFLASARSNLPYSFTDRTLNLDGDYRYDRRVRLGAGLEYQTRDRTNQEVDHTKEDTGWGKLSLHLLDNLDVSLKGAHSERDASGYHAVSEIQPVENPLLTKYNLADRSRDTGSIQASYSPHERISLGLGFDLSRDSYTKSLLGLTGSRDYNVNADAAIQLAEATSMHLFAGHEYIQSDQVGSQSFAQPDWFAHNNDTVDSFGVGVKHQLIKDRMDIGADYVVNRSTGEVTVDVGAPGGTFPDLKTRLDSIRLYADYRMKENMTLHAVYWYENYDSSDWMLDGVDPDTVTNLLGAGIDSPGYSVHAVMLSLRYRY